MSLENCIGFHIEDTVGLGTESIPFYGIKLSREEADQVKNGGVEIYSTDGFKMFKIMDRDHQWTGEYMLYIVFPRKA